MQKLPPRKFHRPAPVAAPTLAQISCLKKGAVTVGIGPEPDWADLAFPLLELRELRTGLVGLDPTRSTRSAHTPIRSKMGIYRSACARPCAAEFCSASRSPALFTNLRNDNRRSARS